MDKGMDEQDKTNVTVFYEHFENPISALVLQIPDIMLILHSMAFTH